MVMIGVGVLLEAKDAAKHHTVFRTASPQQRITYPSCE